MNFYLLSVFVILCFGPWTIAKEVYQRLSKNSGELLEEKQSNAEARFHILNGFFQVTSQAQTWIQCLRKLLKATKKWFNSHPYEVKLGKCLASYLNSKIPGLSQHGQISRYSEDSQGADSPFKISRKIPFTRRAAAAAAGYPRSTFNYDFLEKSFIYIYFRDLFVEIGNRFVYYRDVFMKDKLVVCVSDYFWKKFWTWVDLSPDSKCKF